MKRIFFIFLIFLINLNLSYAQEQIISLDDKETSVLNEELRNKVDTHSSQNIFGNKTFKNSSIFKSSIGAYGQIISYVATGTSPFSITSTTAVTNLNSDLLDGQHGSYYLDNVNTSNVIFNWFGSNSANTNSYGLVEGTSLTPNMSSYTINYHFFGVYGNDYRTILTGKFVKIAGISTITIYSKLWNSSDNTAVLNVDIGGQSNTVTIAGSTTTPTWATASTINVSGLTNGTAYDITIQLKNGSSSQSSYCSAVVLTAS